MFLKKMIKTSTNEIWASIEKLRRLLVSADALVIGAGGQARQRKFKKNPFV